MHLHASALLLSFFLPLENGPFPHQEPFTLPNDGQKNR